MKWEALEPEPGVYDYAAADRLVQFARANNQKVRGHMLVWHNQNPAWLTEDAYTPAQLREILRKHVIETARHFRGKIWHWDVVNEIFNDDGTWRDTIWYRNLGPGYVADAFRWAHRADPNARLYLNDYNNEGLSPKSDAYYALVKQLKAEGVPVQGYGVQGHLAVQYGFPVHHPAEPAALRETRAGHRVHRGRRADAAAGGPDQGAGPGAGFHHAAAGLPAGRRCVSYTLWGFTDRYSWVPGVFDRPGLGHPADRRPDPRSPRTTRSATRSCSPVSDHHCRPCRSHTVRHGRRSGPRGDGRQPRPARGLRAGHHRARHRRSDHRRQRPGRRHLQHRRPRPVHTSERGPADRADHRRPARDRAALLLVGRTDLDPGGSVRPAERGRPAGRRAGGGDGRVAAPTLENRRPT